MKQLVKRLVHHHVTGRLPSVILFASPRGGSTWVTELIASQPGFWPISEPLNVRSEWVRSRLGIHSHAELYEPKNVPLLTSYYGNLLGGRYADLKLRPGLKFYRPFTNRIVVKENQGCLDRIGWFEDTFGVKVIHLIRHPIPVALSREEFPLLNGFGGCALRDKFSTDELSLADCISQNGSHVEKGVVAWCLHHLPALRAARKSWLRITYEDTVLRPKFVINILANALTLPNCALMQKQIVEPSQVTRKSNPETQSLLTSKENREQLIHKWKLRVSEEDIKKAELILQAFDVSIYSADSPYPAEAMNIDD